MSRLGGLVRRMPERGARRGACGAPVAGADTLPRTSSVGERRAARRPTLDDMLVGAWEDLRTAQAADCPVCGGTMLSPRGAGPAVAASAVATSVVVGTCEDCGTQLS